MTQTTMLPQARITTSTTTANKAQGQSIFKASRLTNWGSSLEEASSISINSTNT